VGSSPPPSSPRADAEPTTPARDVAHLAALIARLVAKELAPLLTARATVDPADVSPRRGTVGKEMDMARRSKPERVLGPYRHYRKWRILLISAGSAKTVTDYENESKARQVVRS
jgi:hypothetical protein